MPSSSDAYLLSCGFLVVIVGLFAMMGGGGIAFVWWASRSGSPAATRFRQWVGGRRDKPGMPRFYTIPEARAARTAAAKALAAAHAYRYIGDSPETLDRLRVFASVPPGRDQSVENLVEARIEGAQLELFTYRFDDIEGSCHIAMLLSHLAEGSLPAFQLTPETILHKALSVPRDVDFTDSPEFSRRYHLEGDDEQKIRELFDPRVRKAFEALETCSVEASGPAVLFKKLSDYLTVEDGEEFLNESTSILRALITSGRRISGR